MNKEQLAALLDGREYGHEITREEAATAKENGLIVVFGASDDLMEFRGAIDDEVGCFEGGDAFLTANGIFENECRDYDCPYAEREREKCKVISAVWCDGSGPCWTYKTDIPHATFSIVEDGEPYCTGIVFAVADISGDIVMEE